MTTLFRRFFVLTLLCMPVLAHAAPGYIKFESIPGMSADDKHKGWIDIESWSFTPLPAAAPRGGPGKFTLIKRVDAASPRLAEAVAKGTRQTTVVVDMNTPTETGYSHAFKYLTINGIKPAGPGRETLELSYDAVERVKSDPAR